MSFHLRRATAADSDALWDMLEPVIRDGETYALDRDMSREAALAAWIESPRVSWIATNDEGTALGTFYVKPNQQGGGNHICNAGFVTSPRARGLGIGRWMGGRAIEEATALGYAAMQFNFVIASNAVAVRLWRGLGFIIIGTVPDAFRHPRLGLVDAYVMYRRLG